MAATWHTSTWDTSRRAPPPPRGVSKWLTINNSTHPPPSNHNRRHQPMTGGRSTGTTWPTTHAPTSNGANKKRERRAHESNANQLAVGGKPQFNYYSHNYPDFSV
uniref:(northern house mosquito) hypothetical protein n=1 Tax=Culex pipiens TaxID=7175 RepID=A0A8D8DVN9_CULPI